MPKILTGNSQKGWPYFQRLLVDLFQFMEPFLRNAELGGPVGCFWFLLVWSYMAPGHCVAAPLTGKQVIILCDWFMQAHFLYKGTLRVLLVLLHDFPEFLCDYHFTFCDVIPPSCIQMRNIILSAFPHNMRLPDPSTPNLKVWTHVPWCFWLLNHDSLTNWQIFIHMESDWLACWDQRAPSHSLRSWCCS